jgi:hypothetical protein
MVSHASHNLIKNYKDHKTKVGNSLSQVQGFMW